MTRASSLSTVAFTLVEIMIVVALIGLLAAIAIPNFLKLRERAQINTCINNLRVIDAAKQQWALDWREPGSARPDFGQLSPYLVRANSSRIPSCPASKSETNFTSSYAINVVTSAPTCLVVPADHVLPY